jgi:hypothetical protein
MAVAFCISSSMLWAQDGTSLPDYVTAEFGEPPTIPQGSLTEDVSKALDDVLAIAVNQSAWDHTDTAALDILAQTHDPRLVWVLTDMQRFPWRPEFRAALTGVADCGIVRRL